MSLGVIHNSSVSMWLSFAHLHTVYFVLAHNDGGTKALKKRKANTQFAGDAQQLQLTGKRNSGIRDKLSLIPSGFVAAQKSQEVVQDLCCVGLLCH